MVYTGCRGDVMQAAFDIALRLVGVVQRGEDVADLNAPDVAVPVVEHASPYV